MTRLALKFLKGDWRRNAVLAASILSTLLAALVLTGIGRSIVDRAETQTRDRLGAARISFAPAGRPSVNPSTGIRLVGAGEWITSEQEGRIAEILRLESVTVSAAVTCDALLVDDQSFKPVRVTSRRTPVNDGGYGRPEASLGQPRLLVAFATGTDGVPRSGGFLDIQEFGNSWWEDPQHLTVGVNHQSWLRALKAQGLAPVSAVGTALLVEAPAARSPSVVAYNARELLTTEFPEVQVLSVHELTGRSTRVSAVNIPLLISLAVLMVGAATIVAVVLVTTESRSDELTLLGTLGFGVPLIRKLLVCEVLLVSVAASLAGSVLYIAVAGTVPGLSVELGPLIKGALAALLAPAGLAFLVTKHALSGTVHDRLAEFRR